MAKYELSIYGEDDEKIETFERNIVPTGLYIEALEVADNLDRNNVSDCIEKTKQIYSIVQKLFPKMTKEQYYNQTDKDDVLNTFYQLCGKSASLRKGDTSKN